MLNNNLSVLPFYSSAEEQDARKWWAYGKGFTLISPLGVISPFQILRKAQYIQSGTPELIGIYTGYIAENGGGAIIPDEYYRYGVYSVSGETEVLLENATIYDQDSQAVVGQAYDEDSNFISSFKPIHNGVYNGVWHLPQGTDYICVQIFNGRYHTDEGDVHLTERTNPSLSYIHLYNKDDVFQVNLTSTLRNYITITQVGEYDIICFDSNSSLLPNLYKGSYYLKISDGTNIWYSDIFTLLDNTTDYFSIEWSCNSNLLCDDGLIYYEGQGFINRLYIPCTIGMPSYEFEEEGKDLGGYFFPTEIISSKVYNFKFLATEYVCDVMRTIRMSDTIIVRDGGNQYNLSSFEMEVEWQEQGYLAEVNGRFTTNTIIKKL